MIANVSLGRSKVPTICNQKDLKEGVKQQATTLRIAAQTTRAGKINREGQSSSWRKEGHLPKICNPHQEYFPQCQ